MSLWSCLVKNVPLLSLITTVCISFLCGIILDKPASVITSRSERHNNSLFKTFPGTTCQIYRWYLLLVQFMEGMPFPKVALSHHCFPATLYHYSTCSFDLLYMHGCTPSITAANLKHYSRFNPLVCFTFPQPSNCQISCCHHDFIKIFQTDGLVLAISPLVVLARIFFIDMVIDWRRLLKRVKAERQISTRPQTDCSIIWTMSERSTRIKLLPENGRGNGRGNLNSKPCSDWIDFTHCLGEVLYGFSVLFRVNSWSNCTVENGRIRHS